jgi:alpha-mannosidase II
MRRRQALLLLLAFSIAVIALNLLLRISPSEEPAKVDVESQQRISILKHNVEILENQLDKDKQNYHKLKQLASAAIKSLSKTDKPIVGKQTKISQVNTSIPKISKSKAKPVISQQLVVPQGKPPFYPSSDCQFSGEPSGLRSDVRMLDVFDMMSFTDVDGGVWKQGFDITYSLDQWRDKPLKVFVVPHSHNDPGWLKTFEQYYAAQTRNILSNVVNALSQDPNRRFIWAEISYFDLWWGEQSNERKDLVKKLIQNGQLEIVTGGWVMNDEANTHYYAMVDQIIEGHEWLKQNLAGTVPHSGWAIDPFGHSPTMAYLLERMGFDFMLIQRVHYSVKKYLAERKELEFRWRQNWDHGSTTDMFCHMMPFYSYDIPHTCGPDPKICCQFDFRRLRGGGISCPWKVPPEPISDGNVAQRAEMLLDQYRKKSQLFKTNVLLVPLGDDFRYDREDEVIKQYTNYEKLFSYINSHQELRTKVQFGTLSEYRKAINEEYGSVSGFPTLSGDFYTYADRADHYWSGYFTSRPFFKLMDRLLESALRKSEILFTLATVTSRMEGPRSFPVSELFHLLTSSRRNLGLFQHHDGITGTAKDHVVVDYGNRMLSAINLAQQVMLQSAQFVLADNKHKVASKGIFLDLDEEIPSFDSRPVKKAIALSSTKPKQIFLYNSLEYHRIQTICVVVTTRHVKVSDSSSNPVASQVNPVWVDRVSASTDKFELCFVAQVPAISIAQYNLMEDNSNTTQPTLSKVTTYGTLEAKLDGFSNEHNELSEISITNDVMSATFSAEQGLLKSVTKLDGVSMMLNMGFVLYGTVGARDKSGAYLFLPDGEARPVTDQPELVRVIEGPLIKRVTSFLPHVECEVTLTNSPGLESQSVHVHNLVDIRDLSNREIAMRMQSGISNTNRVFFTDLNGFQIQRHQTLDKLPLQANVYPMPTMAFIQDSKTRLSLVSSQSLGFASLKLGWMEVILDRRLMQDDNRGLGQGVRDNKLTPSSFWVLVEQSKDPAANTAEQRLPTAYPSLLAHLSSQQLIHSVSVLVPQDNAPDFYPSFSGMSPLPCDIHLVNLRLLYQSVGASGPAFAALLLHRKGYDCHYPSPPVTCDLTEGKVSLKDLFHKPMSSARTRSLSLIHDKGPVDLNTPLQIPPMELYAYQLNW